MSKGANVKENKPKRIGLKIFLTIIVIVVMLICGVYAYIHQKLGEIQQEKIDITAVGIDETVSENLKEYRNIALFGIDSRADDYGLGNRSDCIIIASLNEKTGEVKLVSVYRDTYVYVTENGKERLDKITHAYSYGGAQNAVKSLNEALDLNITEYVTVNFDAVIVAVDALGGIEITIEPEELKYINDCIDATSKSSGVKSKHITKSGEQTLDGVQAVAYSRIRYTTGGDYKRTERMRTVITSMVSKAKTISIAKLLNVADKVLPKISTNISQGEIISLMPRLLTVKIGESLGWPYYTKGITLDRWYGVPITLESNVLKLHQEIFGEENYTVSSKVKEMSDAIIKATGYTN